MLVAVADAVAAAVRGDMHRIQCDLDAGEALAGEAAQHRVVVAGNVGHARAARDDREQLGQHFAVIGTPPRPLLQILEIDDVADEIEALALHRAQEVEQIAGLTIAQAEMNVRNEHAAEREP